MKWSWTAPIKLNKVICISTKTPTKQPASKKRWLSPSSINAYLRCPRKYYYSKIARLKEKPSIYLIRGIAVHSAIDKFYKLRFNRCADTDYSDLRKAVTDLLTDEWQSQEKDLQQLKLHPDERAFFYHESYKMMINFLHDFLRDRGFEKPEPTLEKTLFSKKYMLLGRIDAIHNNVDPPLIIDFKTCKSKEFTDDYRRQLGLYALLYEENFNIKPALGIHFLKFQNGLEKYSLSDKDIEEMRDLVLDIHRKTLSENIEDYPCTCGWCDTNFGIKGTKPWNR